MSARLPQLPGEWIDRSRTIRFSFEGRPYSGYAGDTIGSALWAAGVRQLGRSFKYHRSRGILSFANHDINTMMQNGGELNLRADIVPLRPGMALQAVNTFGGLRRDLACLLDGLSPFLPVGFYYKAFHTPKKLFPYWERLFRALTGLGRVEFANPREITPKRYDFTDVLVIGAGAAGLSAALTAARGGLQVVVVDENARAGGSRGYNRGGEDAVAELDRWLADLRTLPNVEIRTSTLAAGYYADYWVPLIDAGRMTKMRARAVIVASGAWEQPAVFRNNDLPGVMLASAAQRLIYRYAVKPCERALLLVANSDGYRAALDLAAHGVQIAAILDLRLEGEKTGLSDRVQQAGITVRNGWCVYEALPAKGGTAVRGAQACPLDGRGEADAAKARGIACDGILMSVGWVPAAPLLYQAGTRMRYDLNVHQFVPEALPMGVFAAGRVNGVYDLASKISDGKRAARAALAFLGAASAGSASGVPAETVSPSHPYPIIAHPKAKNFVDFDEDLQLKDFVNAVQEGFDNIELLKRYTTVGMGPSQGKHSNMNAVRILARLTGLPIEEVGTTTARPFYHPVPLSHLAGRGFHAERLTALHPHHQAAAAVFMQAGVWLRPEYYAQPGRSKVDCVRGEAAAVRNGVGMIDVGTLGKLEISGPDAAEFLERIYTGRYGNMKAGTTRYALMLDEAGVIIDDGVVARLAEYVYYFTTTTTNSATIYRELTRLNTQWRLNCGIVNLTGAVCSMNLAGPRAREVLAAVSTLDVSATSFPYLAVREGEIAGVPARVLRAGFLGEVGYEIHAPADRAPAVWEALAQAGQAHGIRPFGVEAQRLLRLEKGHIIIGQDTDGLTTPLEAGLEGAVKMDKPFFIGQRSLRIVEKQPRKQRLAGFTLGSATPASAPQESHLVIDSGSIAGRVTSVAWSPTLNRHIGLAYLRPDMTAPGSRFTVRVDGGELVWATVAKTPFYDPDNRRQKNVAVP